MPFAQLIYPTMADSDLPLQLILFLDDQLMVECDPKYGHGLNR